MADLGSRLDKMQAYNKILELHGYVRDGDGTKPWSTRWTLGTSHVDIRNSEWTAYPSCIVGYDSQTLAMFLSGDFKTGGYL